MNEKLKNHIKELGIKNGYWNGSDGRRYHIFQQGVFFIHSITITRESPDQNDDIDDEDDGDNGVEVKTRFKDKFERIVDYTALKDNYGRYLNTEYFYTIEDFDILFGEFLAGYKEYQALEKKSAIDNDFKC